jgi:hypothetical protein
MACAAEAGATSLNPVVDPGAIEAIRTALRVAVLQKLGRGRNPSHQATNPVGVFFSPFSPACAGRGEEGGERAATTPHRERRKPTAYKEPELREAAVVNTDLAYAHPYTGPTTTTPPPHREHHRGRPILSSPLVSFL